MTNRRQLIDAVEVTDTGIHVARLKRIFDATSVNEFEKVLAYLISRQHYRIVVDLSQVEFVASAGWGAFTAEFRNVRKAGGDIRLAGMNPDVQDVFFLLELDSFINAYETVDEAIESFEIEMRAMQALPPAESAPAPTESAAEEAPALVEFVKPPQHDEAEEMLEAEPVAFEVTDVYTPERHSPLALGSGKGHPPASDYEHLTPTLDEEEDWEVAEASSESNELVPYSAEEAFAAFDAEIALDAEVEEIEEEAPVVEKKPAAPARAKAAALPAAPSKRASRPSAEDWPEAHAEENVASEDFELQDIHDPWILEEIDTLPEEDELEASSWSEDFDEEPPPPKAKPSNNAAAPIASPASTKSAAPARVTRNEKQSAPATENAPRAAEPTATTAPSLADRMKAASKTQAPVRTLSVNRELSEEEHVNLVRQIVSEHPHYGPAMIQSFFETRLDPPVPVSRSTVYRWLRLAGLNTREQRLAFAGKADL